MIKKKTMNKTEILNLTTQQLYDHILKYFNVRELVSPGLYEKYINYGVYFILSRFDKRLLETILWVRINVNLKITVNTWLWGGRFEQRGLRDTSTTMVQSRAKKNVAWLSAHTVAMALDYDVEGQTAVEHREWLKQHENELPHKIRLERNYKNEPISWVHLDVCDDPKNPKIYEFDI